MLFAILFSCLVIAQSEEKQTLFQANAQHGGFAGLAFKLSRVDDTRFGMLGVRFGWIINRTFSLGAAYYGMANRLTHYTIYAPEDVQPAGNSRYYLFDTYHGGLEIEYIHKPDKQVFLSASSLLGIGHVRYPANNSAEILSDDRHVFIEPSLNVNVNISNHSKFIVGFSYMIATGVKAEGLTKDSLSGFTLNAAVAFGFF